MVYVVSLASWRTRSAGTRLAASLPSKTSLQESFDLAFDCPYPCPSPCSLTPLSLHPQLLLSLLGVRNGPERFSCFVCLGHALIELWGFSLRSLQLFYVNYSLQAGVSFSWLSCTFLVLILVSVFRPLSALNQVELTASLAQALDIINLYLDSTCLSTYVYLFVRVSCLVSAVSCIRI